MIDTLDISNGSVLVAQWGRQPRNMEVMVVWVMEVPHV